MNLSRSLWALCLCFVSIAAFAGSPNSKKSDDVCQFNCVSSEKQGATLLITWRGLDGEVVKVFAVDIGEDAKFLKKIDPKVNPPIGTTTADVGWPGSVRVETETTTYHYPGGVTVVTITSFYDTNGNLLGVDVHVYKFSTIEK